MICKYFLPFCMLSFHLLEDILRCIKVLNFDEVQFIFSFVAYALDVISKNPLPNSISYRFTSMFSSKSLIVLALIFRLFFHF